MKARQPAAPAIVGDLKGGEFARVPAGLVRITQRHDVHDGQRWAILLRDDFTEVARSGFWLRPTTPAEVVTPPERRPGVADVGGGDFDPLRGEP